MNIRQFAVWVSFLLVACSDDKPATPPERGYSPPTGVYPPRDESVEAGAPRADIVIPDSLPPELRKMLELSWPKVRNVCRGLDKYALLMNFSGVEALGPFVTSIFEIPEEANFPTSFMVKGHTCYFELAKDGSYVQIAKEGCKALCLGRPIEKGSPEYDGDLRIPLPVERPATQEYSVASNVAAAASTISQDGTLAQRLIRLSVGRAPLAKEVRRAEKALKAAAAVCQQDEGQLLYLSVVFQHKLAEVAQIDVQPIELIEAMPIIFSGTKQPRDCRQTMVNYSAGRSGTQQNHEQGVVVMRQLFSAGIPVDKDLTNK